MRPKLLVNLIHGFSPVNARLLITCDTAFYAITNFKFRKVSNIRKETPVSIFVSFRQILQNLSDVLVMQAVLAFLCVYV